MLRQIISGSPHLSGTRQKAALAVFCGACAFASLPAYAEVYLGKVCLQSTIKERESGPVSPEEKAVVTYDINSLGGNVYALSGRVNIPDQPFVFTGMANLIGNVLYMNITTTQSHPDGWRDTGVEQVQLNLSTMTGTFYENGHDFKPSTKQWDSRYTAGTVEKVACP